MTGEETTCRLIDGTERRFPIVRLHVDTPYYTGDIRAMSIKEPLYELILGNIPEIRIQPNPNWKAETGVRTTRDHTEVQAKAEQAHKRQNGNVEEMAAATNNLSEKLKRKGIGKDVTKWAPASIMGGERTSITRPARSKGRRWTEHRAEQLNTQPHHSHARWPRHWRHGYVPRAENGIISNRATLPMTRRVHRAEHLYTWPHHSSTSWPRHQRNSDNGCIQCAENNIPSKTAMLPLITGINQARLPPFHSNTR